MKQREYLEQVFAFLNGRNQKAYVNQIEQALGRPPGVHRVVAFLHLFPQRLFLQHTQSGICVHLIPDKHPFDKPALVPMFTLLIRLHDEHARSIMKSWPLNKKQLLDACVGWQITVGPLKTLIFNLQKFGYLRSPGAKFFWNHDRIADASTRAPQDLKKLCHVSSSMATTLSATTTVVASAKASADLNKLRGYAITSNLTTATTSLPTPTAMIAVGNSHDTTTSQAQHWGLSFGSLPTTSKPVGMFSSINSHDVTASQAKEFTVGYGTHCTFISNVDQLSQIMPLTQTDMDVSTDGKPGRYVALGCQGTKHSPRILAMAMEGGKCCVLDYVALGKEAVWRALLPLLESPSTIILVHDLYGQGALARDAPDKICQNLLDSQLVGEFGFEDGFQISLCTLLSRLGHPVLPTDTSAVNMKKEQDYWAQRPVKASDLEYAAVQVVNLLGAASKIVKCAGNELKTLMQASADRFRHIQEFKCCDDRAMCFNAAKSYRMASPELMRAIWPKEGRYGRPLVMESEADDVVRILPRSFQTKLHYKAEDSEMISADDLAVPPTEDVGMIRHGDVIAVPLTEDADNIRHSDIIAVLPTEDVDMIRHSDVIAVPPAEDIDMTRPSDVIQDTAALTEYVGMIRDGDIVVVPSSEKIDMSRLSDISLDIGRRPHCWVDNKRIFLNDDESILVEGEDIEQITKELGKIGGDNRAGLNGKLHRFSVIRTRDGTIAGVTIRIGRSVIGNADFLIDFLLGSNKSILFLGEPGSGKTTIVREATRILAEDANVLVVDTSNEIAGDGLVPHKCIGMARRMMVPSLDQQSDVMIECVQNHTTTCMVIDEIGRPKEVLAARTVKQRGVRIIASAHGDLRKLVKNKELRGLLGGVEQVVMGDAMAKEEAGRRQRMLEKDAKAGGSMYSSTTFNKTKTQRAGEPTFDVIVEVQRGAYHQWRVVTDTAAAVDRILDGRKYEAEYRTRNPETGMLYVKHVTA